MAYRLIEAYDHSGGMNTREAPYLLNSREFADCENVTLEEAGKVKTRKGHQNYKTLPAPSGLRTISTCDDAAAGGTWTGADEFPANGMKEGEGYLQGAVTLGQVIDACDTMYDPRWYDASIDGESKYQGSASLVAFGGLTPYRVVALDLSDLQDSALFQIALKASAGGSGTLMFCTDDDNYYSKTYTGLTTSFVLRNARKDSFTATGSPDWSDITKIKMRYNNESMWEYMHFDYISVRERDKEGSCVLTFAASKDYSDLTNEAEISLWAKRPTGAAVTSAVFALAFNTDDDYCISPGLPTAPTEDWQKLATTKALFAEEGSPAWGNIDSMTLYCNIALSGYATIGTEYTFGADYIVWQDASVENKITGIYEYRLPDGETIYRLAVIGTNIYDLDTLDELQGDDLTPALDCTFATMDGKVFLANGTDKMQYWDGSAATFANVGADTWPAGDDSPPECKYICVHKDRLWCFGCTADGLEAYLVFSELGDPSIADMWPANNWFHAGPHDGSIATGMAVFSDYLVLFTRKYIYCLYGETDENFNMVARKDCPGCIAPKSIAVSDDGIYYLAYDGIRLFNGNESILISDVIRSTVKNEVSLDDLDKAVGVYHNGTYRCWVVEDDGDSGEAYPDMALVYDAYLKAWVRWRGMYFNCFGVLGDKLYGGLCATPSIVECDIGYSDDGAAIRTMLKTRQINAGVPERDKYFHHVYVVPDSTAAAYDLSVRAQTEKSATYREYDIPLQSPDDNLAEHRETISLKGKYLELEFSHEGVNEPVAITGYRVGYKQLAVK